MSFHIFLLLALWVANERKFVDGHPATKSTIDFPGPTKSSSKR